MIDFKIKGTRLPKLVNVKVSCGGWMVNSFRDMDFKLYEIYKSFGFNNRHGFTCVLVEIENFSGDNFWEIPIELIEQLAQEQGMFEGKLIGYKAPFEIGSWNVKLGDVFIPHPTFIGSYYTKTKNVSSILPHEIVEKWEAIYEKNEETLILGENKVKVIISKEGVFVDGNKLSINDIRSLIHPNRLINQTKYTELDGEEPIRGYAVELLDATYKIGCSKFKLADLKTVLKIYNDKNRIT